jgi:amidase
MSSAERVVFDGASKIATGIRRGDYSSREITQSFISRIERFDGQVNAVVVRRFEEALKEADAADAARAAGRVCGPLHGVPMTIKECFDFAGLPTTYGHPSRAKHQASADAVTVARLRAAGAIVLGKTNVPKDLADWETYNDVYGHTRNPWDLNRSAGGSSGGSAAALAAGFSALELGSDIGGSIRTPATFCGVYGHKPTFGIVPIRGANNPDETLAPRDLLVAGPMAQTAVDLEIALDVVAGPDVDDGAVGQAALPQETRDRLQGWRIALVADDPVFRVDSSIRNALETLGSALESEGAIVDREAVLPLPSQEHYELYITLLRSVTSSRYSLEEIEALRAKTESFAPSDKSYDALMHRGLTLSHAAWIRADDRRLALRRRWREFFGRYDALICPSTTVPAIVHHIGVARKDQFFSIDGKMYPGSNNYYWIGLPNLAYLPATAIPIGSEEGIPIGAQIIGPECGDKRCIRLAQLLESTFRAFKPAPSFASLDSRAVSA